MLDLAPPPAAAGRAPDEATRGGASGRERLLAAAAAQFAAKGYVATSVRDIVNAAGVKAPALYYHFGSKEGLFLALAREAMAKIEQYRDEALAAGGTAVARIRRLCRAHAAIRREYAGLSWIVDQILSGPPEAAPAIDFRGLGCEWLRLFERLVEEGIAQGELRPCPASDLALALLGAVEIAARAEVFGICGQTPEDSLEGMLDLLLARAVPAADPDR